MVFLAFFLGVAGGAVCVFILMFWKYQQARAWNAKQEMREEELRRSKERLEGLKTELDSQRQEFDDRVIKYNELGAENEVLKRDLQNLDVQVRKLHLDTRQQEEKQKELDQRVQEIGQRYLSETEQWVGKSLNTNNFAKCKERLVKCIQRVRAIGFDVPEDEELKLLQDLKTDYEKVVRADFERQEQARIRAQIREEQKREKEIERELQTLDREKEAIEAALQRALADAKDEHAEEIQRLRERLAEAEARAERAKSQAQLTKSGHVYVISNIGSFGDNVYKVGLTRRLEPLDRVRELGDASVPFPFDVHMMISADDAPALENALHRALHKSRLNKVNPRKEYFRADLDTIREVVQQHHGSVDYVADPEALEYRQSLELSDEDAEFIDSVYESLDDEGLAED